MVLFCLYYVRFNCTGGNIENRDSSPNNTRPSTLGIVDISGNESDTTQSTVGESPNSNKDLTPQSDDEIGTGNELCGAPNCLTCNELCLEKNFKINGKNYKVKHFTCETSNVIYLIQCEKEGCEFQRVEGTRQTLRNRMNQIRRYIRQNIPNSRFSHFNSPSHSIKVMIIQQEVNEQERKKMVRKWNTKIKRGRK